MKVNGLNYQDIGRALDLKGTDKQDLHNKAKRLVDQALRAGLPDPDRVGVMFKDDAQRANLSRIRPKDCEEPSANEAAKAFVKLGWTRAFLAEVMEKMKEIEGRFDQ